MSRACSICRNTAAGSINGELRAPDCNIRQVAAAYGLSYDAVWRHSRHVTSTPPVAAPTGTTTAAATPPPTASTSDPLAELVEALRPRALAGSDPSTSREYRLGLAALEARGTAVAPPFDLHADPEYIAVQTLLIKALDAYPDAKLAVIKALRADREVKIP